MALLTDPARPLDEQLSRRGQAFGLCLWLALASGVVAGAQPHALSTADGLSLDLRQDGTVSGLRLAGQEILDQTRLAESGFALIDMTDPARFQQANLIPDPGFEAVGEADGAWRLHRHKELGKDSFVVDDATRHGGRFALRLEVTEDDVSGARIRYSGPTAALRNVHVQPETVHVLSFWLKSGRGVFGTSGVLVGIRQQDPAGEECGRPYFVKFPIFDDPAWRRMTFQFMTDPQAGSVSIAVHPHESPVMLWLDDFSLVPVAEPPAEPMRGRVERQEDGTLLQVARSGGFLLESRYRANDDHIAVDAELSATEEGDRAVVLCFALPIRAEGWTWWDDIETPRQVAERGRCGRLRAAGNGAMMSAYPFSSLSQPGVGGISLANRIDEPRIFRLTCSADRGLSIAYDLGLSQASRKFPGRAKVRFLIYAHDARWGFRSAADKYYRIIPEAFTCRVQVHGNWFTRGVVGIRFPEDYEPGYLQGGARPEPYLVNKRHGFLSERNAVPWTWFHPVVEAEAGAQRVPRPRYEDALKRIEEDTNAPEEQGAYHAYYITLRDMARACLNCGVHDAQGQFVSKAWRNWHDGARWMEHWQMNTDPDLPGLNRAQLWTRDEFEPEVRRVSSLGGRVDGAHYDSLSGLRLNFRREHFAFADLPLTFDYETRRVAQLQAFHHVEFLRYVSDRLWSQGLSVSANQWGTWMIYAPWLDWLGAETQISYGGGAEMRTLAYHKPVSYINEDGFWKKPAEEMRSDAEHYMLYAEFPGRVGPEEARHLARKYMPIITELSMSGWEPITHARARDPTLRVERFGNWAAGNLHFAAYNPGADPVRGSVSVHAGALGIGGAEPCVVRELVSNRLLDPRRESGDIVVDLELGARRGLALRVSRADLSPYHMERAARALEHLAEFASTYRRFGEGYPLPWLVEGPGLPPIDEAALTAISEQLAATARGLRSTLADLEKGRPPGRAADIWPELDSAERAFRGAPFFAREDVQLACDKLTLVREYLSHALAPGICIRLASEPCAIAPAASNKVEVSVSNESGARLPRGRLRLSAPEGFELTPEEAVVIGPLHPGESVVQTFDLTGSEEAAAGKPVFTWAELVAGDVRIGSRLHLLVSSRAAKMGRGPARLAAGVGEL